MTPVENYNATHEQHEDTAQEQYDIIKQPKERRDNLKPETIRGDYEFFMVWGYSRNQQTQLRSKGMPTHYDGKCFFYYPDEVNEWLKKTYPKIKVPQLPEPKPTKTAKL